MNFSPKLKVAMKEIEAILAKHDIGGVMVLCDGDGLSEWRLAVDTPSWSLVRFIGEGKALHVKMYSKSKPEETNKTLNMLVHCQDVTGRLFMLLDDLRKRIENSFEIEVGKPTWTDGGP